MPADRPLLGIMLMLGFCIIAPLGDAFAKILGDKIPLMELLLVRFAAQIVLLVPLIIVLRLPWRMSRRVTYLVILRTVLHMLGIAAMFISLRYLPLADAVAIAFVMPFIMLFLGKYILGEEIGNRRVIASLVGFIGTLFIVQPSFVSVGAPALLPLCVAVVFAFFMLTTRQIAKETDPVALQALSGGIAVLMMIPVIWIGGLNDWTPAKLFVPDNKELILLLLLGVLGTVAHLFMTWSLRFAEAATLAPMQYLEIPVATLFGLIIFGDLPNGMAAFGILITIAAGIYIILREQANMRRTQAGSPHSDEAQRVAE